MILFNSYLHELSKFSAFNSLENHRNEIYDLASTNGLSLEEGFDKLLMIKERELLRQKYSYAIPNDEAINVIAQLSPIVEVGAGTGYWASMISKCGGTITAYDCCGENGYVKPDDIGKYYPVERWNPDFRTNWDGQNFSDYLKPDHSLFICWPPIKHPMADDYLEAYEGNTFIFVGEGPGGCTGDNQFHERLKDDWDLVRTVSIPQFPSIHDFLAVYSRRPKDLPF